MMSLHNVMNRLIAILTCVFACAVYAEGQGAGIIDGQVATSSSGTIVYKDTGDVTVDSTIFDFSSSIETDQGFADAAGRIVVGAGLTSFQIDVQTATSDGFYDVDLILEIPVSTTFTPGGFPNIFRTIQLTPAGPNPGVVDYAARTISAGTYRIRFSGFDDFGSWRFDLDGEYPLAPLPVALADRARPNLPREITLSALQATGGPPSQFILETLPANGMLLESDGTPIPSVPAVLASDRVHYVASAAFLGIDTFSFRAADADGRISAPAPVDLDVMTWDDPIADDRSYSVIGGEETFIRFAGESPLDGRSGLPLGVGEGPSQLLYVITQLPTQGSLTSMAGDPIVTVPHAVTDPGVMYTSLPGTSLFDSFEYLVDDSAASPPATVEIFIPAHEFVRVDPNRPNSFGHGDSLDADNDVVLIGIPREQADGYQIGRAVLLSASTGAELGSMLSPADGLQEADQFGRSVALDWPIAVVGVPYDDSFLGSVAVFDVTDPTSPQLMHDLTPQVRPNNGRFGSRVALDGSVLLAATSGSDRCVVAFDVNTGQELATLKPSDEPGLVGFGNSLAVSGTTAVIGASSYPSSFGGPSAGAVYIYDLTTLEETRLWAPTRNAYNYFGGSVAINEHVIVVSEIGDDYVIRSGGWNYTPSLGSVHVFDRNTLLLLSTIRPPNIHPFDYFGTGAAFPYADFQYAIGSSVALDGNRLLLGAGSEDRAGGDNKNGGGFGAAYLFDLSDPSNPIFVRKFAASDGAENHYVGSSVALTGNRAIASAPGTAPTQDSNGSVYLFEAPFVIPDCPADLTTTGTTGGQPGFGTPDGETNLSDLQFYLTAWQTDLGMTPGSLADINTTGTSNGMPDGEINLSDLQFFLTQWQNGLSACP